jgi:chaperonin GroES
MTVPKPTHDHVIVQPLMGPSKTEGGIHIPDTARKKTSKGEVMAVGPGKLLTPHAVNAKVPVDRATASKIRAPMSVKPGDRVYYSSYHGMEIEVDGQVLMVFRDEDILAVEER